MALDYVFDSAVDLTATSTTYAAKNTTADTNFTGSATYLVIVTGNIRGTVGQDAKVGLGWDDDSAPNDTDFKGSEAYLDHRGKSDPDGVGWNWVGEVTQPATAKGISVFLAGTSTAAQYLDDYSILAINVADFPSGSFYSDADATGAQHTTTMVTRASVTFTPATNNERWLIIGSSTTTIDSTTVNAEMQLYDGSTVLALLSHEGEHLAEVRPETLIKVLDLANSSQTMSVQTRDDATGVHDYDASYICAINLDQSFTSYMDVEPASYPVDLSGDTINTWYQRASESYTPDSAGDVAVMISMLIDVASFGHRHNVRGQEDNTAISGLFAGTGGHDNTDIVSAFGVGVKSLAASAHTMDIDTESSYVTSGMDLDQVLLVAFRLDMQGGATNATATPSTVASTSTVPVVTVTTGTTPTPAAITATTTVPAVTVTTGTTIVASAITATSTLPTPTIVVTEDATVTMTAITATTTVPAATILYGTTVTMTAITATTTLPTPTIGTGTTVTLTAITVTTTLPTPTVVVTEDATVTMTAITATSTLPAVTVTTGTTTVQTAIAATSTLPTPTITTGGDATATPAAITATSTLPAVTVTTTAEVTPAAITATTNFTPDTLFDLNGTTEYVKIPDAGASITEAWEVEVHGDLDHSTSTAVYLNIANPSSLARLQVIYRNQNGIDEFEANFTDGGGTWRNAFRQTDPVGQTAHTFKLLIKTYVSGSDQVTDFYFSFDGDDLPGTPVWSKTFAGTSAGIGLGIANHESLLGKTWSTNPTNNINAAITYAQVRKSGDQTVLLDFDPTAAGYSNTHTATLEGGATVITRGATVSAGTAVTPTAIAATTTLPTPTITVGTTATPAAISATSTFPAVTVDVPTNATPTPATITITTTIPTPTITIGTSQRLLIDIVGSVATTTNMTGTASTIEPGASNATYIEVIPT